MPLTLINAQKYLVGKLGGKLAFVGKSIITDVPNSDLSFPIATALEALGVSVADYSAVTDDELAALPIRGGRAFNGLSEYYALGTIWGCMTDVTETAVTRTQAWSNMSREILDRMNALEKLYGTYFIALRPLEPGTIKLPFVTGGGGEF